MTKITTAEELDALPVGSVVRDRDRDEWTKRATPAVWVTPETRPFGSEYVARKWAPLTLVSRPDAPAPPAEDRERCGVCDRDGGQHWYDHSPAARQPAPSFTPAQRHAAEQDPALFRIATRAQFGTGEVIDIVLRALGVPMVSAETTTEWGVRWSPDSVEPFPSEMDACDAMAADLDDSGALVQRDAGPWREVSRG